MEIDPLAQRIRAFRKLKGFTQMELAREIGVSVAVLGAVERGARTPDANLIAAISKGLQVDITELRGN